LNIQPTDRSISLTARRNTMPTASMPRKAVLPRMEKRLMGIQEPRLGDPDHHDQQDKDKDDAGLVWQSERPLRGRGGRPLGHAGSS
jgi:hypothetical protein